MVLVSGSADHLIIWDLDNMVARYCIAIHNDQINHISLQVGSQKFLPFLLHAGFPESRCSIFPSPRLVFPSSMVWFF